MKNTKLTENHLLIKNLSNTPKDFVLPGSIHYSPASISEEKPNQHPLETLLNSVSDRELTHEKVHQLLNVFSISLTGKRHFNPEFDTPQTKKEFRYTLLEKEDFDNHDKFHLLYEELLLKKELGEKLSYKDISREQWMKLWFEEGNGNNHLADLFDVGIATICFVRKQLNAMREYATEENKYQRMRISIYKSEHPELTGGRTTNYSQF